MAHLFIFFLLKKLMFIFHQSYCISIDCGRAAKTTQWPLLPTQWPQRWRLQSPVFRGGWSSLVCSRHRGPPHAFRPAGHPRGHHGSFGAVHPPWNFSLVTDFSLSARWFLPFHLSWISVEEYRVWCPMVARGSWWQTPTELCGPVFPTWDPWTKLPAPSHTFGPIPTPPQSSHMLHYYWSPLTGPETFVELVKRAPHTEVPPLLFCFDARCLFSFTMACA